MRLAVVIPCLNEARTIGAVVREAKDVLASLGDRLSWSEVVVSDNGSTDGSQDLARAAGARVVDAPVRGYGAALHWGTASSEADYVITADADGAHDLSLIPAFLDHMQYELARDDGRFDLIVGSRLTGTVLPGGMHALHRYFGTPLLNRMFRVFVGLRTTDCASGMRMVRRRFYKTLGMRCSGMEYSAEILLKTALHRGRYAEIPIVVRPDGRGRPPHLQRWNDGWKYLKTIAAFAPAAFAFAPALVCGVAGVSLAVPEPALGFLLLWFAWAGFVIGLCAKLVHHLEGVRPSRTMDALLARRTSEIGTILAVAQVISGFALLAGTPDATIEVGGAMLAAGGGVTAFGVLLWEIAQKLLISRLDAAWTPVRPRPDRRAAAPPTAG